MDIWIAVRIHYTKAVTPKTHFWVFPFPAANAFILFPLCTYLSRDTKQYMWLSYCQINYPSILHVISIISKIEWVKLKLDT